VAVDLVLGDCKSERWQEAGSNYCYYHSKLEVGLTTPTGKVYPIWPLHPRGYVIL